MLESTAIGSFPQPQILTANRPARRAATKTVKWEDGEIVFARSSMPGDRLGKALIRIGALTSKSCCAS